jgi:hypothetical protein
MAAHLAELAQDESQQLDPATENDWDELRRMEDGLREMSDIFNNIRSVGNLSDELLSEISKCSLDFFKLADKAKEARKKMPDPEDEEYDTDDHYRGSHDNSEYAETDSFLEALFSDL